MDGKYRQNFYRFYFHAGTIKSPRQSSWSSVMEAFKNEFRTAEFLSFKEVLYYEATEDWYAQRDLDEMEREEHNCKRLAQQLCLVTKENRERFFTYVLSKPSPWSVATHLQSYLLLINYTPELDNLHDDKEVYQVELDWI